MNRETEDPYENCKCYYCLRCKKSDEYLEIYDSQTAWIIGESRRRK